jgi:hypothetical protein
MIDYLGNNEKFMRIMSRDGRRIRDDVIGSCLRYSAINIEQQISEFYDPMVWEKAVLYAHPSDLFTAFMRLTSKLYKDEERSGRLPKGRKDGARRKDVDWADVAINFAPQWWMPGIQDPRARRIDPNDFYKLEPAFTNMYMLVSQWLITDFSYTALLQILDISKRYSLDLVSECMEKIDQVRNRSIDYLMAIIEKEMAARHIEMMESKELEERSKKILSDLIDMAEKRAVSVDWDELEKNKEVDNLNKEVFDKVKLS